MAFFLCTLIDGPSWDDAREIREQDGWGDHAAFMDRLVDDGLIVVGGPVGRGDHTAHLIEGEDPRQIRAWLAEDPWATWLSARSSHGRSGSTDETRR